MTDFLALDTSSKYLTVVAKKGEKIVRRYIAECAMKHSVILMSEIDNALKEADMTPSDCAFFAAVTGPGSFTGIRIGISAAKGMAFATGKKLLGVTSFDLIAYNVNSCGNFAVAIDAMHGKYYVCGYCHDKKICLAPCYISGEEVRALGVPVYGFEDLPLENYTKINAGDCLYNAVCALSDNLTDTIHALYVRKSQAEEARK